MAKLRRLTYLTPNLKTILVKTLIVTPNSIPNYSTMYNFQNTKKETTGHN